MRAWPARVCCMVELQHSPRALVRVRVCWEPSRWRLVRQGHSLGRDFGGHLCKAPLAQVGISNGGVCRLGGSVYQSVWLACMRPVAAPQAAAGEGHLVGRYLVGMPTLQCPGYIRGCTCHGRCDCCGRCVACQRRVWGASACPHEHQLPVIALLPTEPGINGSVLCTGPASTGGWESNIPYAYGETPLTEVLHSSTMHLQREGKGSAAHPLALAHTRPSLQPSGAGCRQRKEAQYNGKGATLEQPESTQTRTQVSSTLVCNLSLCVARGRAAPCGGRHSSSSVEPELSKL
jgi:hypothetical protein